MKAKVGLVIGYIGDGYHGIQWNHNIKTIEGAIMKVLFELELITEANSTDPTKIGMKSVSRTDKGVHASYNVVVVKICREVTQEIETELRKRLEVDNIMLYSIVKVTKRFLGHRMADGRYYKYIIPTFFLKLECDIEEYRKKLEKKSD